MRHVLPVLGLLLLASGCSGSPSAEASPMWEGSLPVSGRVYLGHDSVPVGGGTPLDLYVGAACEGTASYAGIAEGAVVEIVDAAGDTVATGALGAGTVQTVPGVTATGGDPYEGTGCVFEWTIPQVSGDGAGYRAAVVGMEQDVAVTAANRTAVNLDLP